MSDDRGALLMDACDQVMRDPAMVPTYDKKTGKVLVTHCNQAALFVAQALGCHEFDAADGSEPLMADQMIDLMHANESGRWRTGTGSEATIHALGGGLAFAVKTSQELSAAHGHLAAVYPVGMQRSDSLKKDVPLVANVGKENQAEKVSRAFPVAKGEPSYFLWELA